MIETYEQPEPGQVYFSPPPPSPHWGSHVSVAGDKYGAYRQDSHSLLTQVGSADSNYRIKLRNSQNNCNRSKCRTISSVVACVRAARRIRISIRVSLVDVHDVQLV